jgi:hypothetical protein
MSGSFTLAGLYGGPNATIEPYTRSMCISNCNSNPEFNSVLNCGPFVSPLFALISQEPEIAKCVINTQSQLQQCIDSCDVIKELNTINNLLIGTKEITNQCIKKMDNITGVSGGDCGGLFAISSFDIDNVTKSIPNISVNDNIKLAYESLIDPQGCNNDKEIKCKSCGIIWMKQYLLQKELFWCQMCSICHVFTPFTIFDFSPFENSEKIKCLEEQIHAQHVGIYNNHNGYWTN